MISPAKLLVVFVVVMIVVGPDRLPNVARQMGAALQALRNFHAKVESEVRETIPSLPSSQQLARYTRSPTALLNTLLDMDNPVPDPGAPPVGPGANGAANGVHGRNGAANGTGPGAPVLGGAGDHADGDEIDVGPLLPDRAAEPPAWADQGTALGDPTMN